MLGFEIRLARCLKVIRGLITPSFSSSRHQDCL